MGGAMNEISGRVVLIGSGAGIRDVLVVVYDVDPKTASEEGSPSSERVDRTGSASPPGDRIGSVLTAADGSFRIAYEDAEFRIRNPDERRPDLLLEVLAPEQADTDLGSQVLYVSRAVRQDAGRIEQYQIGLTVDRLRKAGIEPPVLGDETD